MSDPYDLSGAKKQGASAPEAPKLQVDSDWKAQAAAEREKLAAKEREMESKSTGRSPAGAEEFPPADFGGLVGTLASQALLYMGGMPDPETGRAIVAPEYARHAIDLLGVVQEKTKGNLTEQEAHELSEVLAELRSRYVQVSRAVAAAMAERMAAGGGPAAGGPNVGPMGGARSGGSPIVGL